MKMGGQSATLIETIGKNKPFVIFSILSLTFICYFEPLQNSLWKFKSICGDPCRPFQASSLATWNPYEKYLVDTQGCKISNLDPFDKSIIKFIGKQEDRKCGKPIVKLVDQRLIVDEEVVNSRYQGQDLKCCYQKITRVNQDPDHYDHEADFTIKTDKNCLAIEPGPNGMEMVDQYAQISCMNTSNKLVRRDFVAVPIPPDKFTNETKSKANYWKNKRAMGEMEQPPSVLVIGLDSISRLHMMRMLPKTREFLFKNDFIELKGYTKIGSNTFPSVMAAFAGLHTKDYKTCWKSRYSKIDDCPFLWKNFSEQNYLTAYLEDSPGLNIFNYDKTGFVIQPADYYLRPIMLADQKFRKYSRYSSNTSCMMGLGPTYYIMNYIRQFIANLGSVNPFFLFSWFTSAGHDYFNTLKPKDEGFEKFLEEMVDKTGNNTLIIFMSDHGYRWGKFRETFLGFYEESLPFFFLRIPEKIKQRFPQWYSNIKINSQRLTTPFDLYHAFVKILNIAQNQSSNVKKESPLLEEADESKNLKLQNESSLFDISPVNRTCESSRIPQQYCMCGVHPQVATDSKFMKSIGKFVVQKVNSDLKHLIESKMCLRLQFSKLHYARQLSENEVWNNLGKFEVFTDYLLALVTQPGEGTFEVKVRVFKNSTQVILGEVNRVNSYAGKSDCITDYVMKNYCMCTSIWRKELKKKRMEEKLKKTKEGKKRKHRKSKV